jgi:AraC-like DNA-binding protein
MEFISRRPAAPLDDWVDLVWLCRGNERDVRQPRALERVLPSGAAQLIVNLAEDETRIYEESPSGLLCQRSPGSILSGLRTRYQVIDTDEQAFVAGVVFRPGGTVPFVPAPALDLSDADVPLESLWGRQRDRLLREQLLSARDSQSALDVLEAALLDGRREKAAHPAVGYALSEFRAHPSIARVRAVTDAIGLSPKRFIERFKADVGVTPKRYCRLLRFQRVVTRAHRDAPADWAELALACGYFDQAHLIHDFRAFSGLTPTAYEARRTGFQNHVTFLQSADR